VTVGGSQKGLMLPPGLSFNAVSPNARAAAKSARLPRSFWDWEEMIAANARGFFPYTPATTMIQGLRVALETNTLPGLTERSLLPRAAAAAGLDYRSLCVALCLMALAAHDRRNGEETP
jgi:alanine-glyoxylate transaminase/serine-glyoxylate transaminase/serine-pyruvate transaminase